MDIEARSGNGPARSEDTGEDDSEPTVLQQQPVPEEIRSLSTMAEPDYVDLFTMTAGIPGRSPEQWARTVLADVLGRTGQVLWRGLLGLRLTASPDRVAGWKIADRGEDWIRLEAASWFLTARLVVEADDEHVSLATFVHYDRPIASRIWPPVSTRHRVVVPIVLCKAYTLLRPAASARQ
jgi:hypothetical protein